MDEMLQLLQVLLRHFLRLFLLQNLHTAQVVDLVADLLLILDEVISQVDEVDDDEVEVVGKKWN